MSTNDIILAALCGVILIGLLYLLFQTWKHSRGTTVIATDEETIDGERTLCANTILNVMRFYLQSVVQEDPIAASSPDGARSYFKIVTAEGHILVQFDWNYGWLRLNYNLHLDTGESSCTKLNLRIRNNAVNEVKLTKFCTNIVESEMDIIEQKVIHSDKFKEIVGLLLEQAKQEQENETENGGE